MNKLLKAAIVLFGMIGATNISHAATFTFTGDVFFQNSTDAALFGLTTNTTEKFTANIELDSNQSAVLEVGNSSIKQAYYNIGSIDVVLGTQNWSNSSLTNTNFSSTSDYLRVAQVTSPTKTYDQLGIVILTDSTTQTGLQIISNSFTAENDVSGQFNSDFNDDVSASQLNLFNSLAQVTTDGRFVFSLGNGNISYIILSNITMSVSAVPLPAGVWLFGTVFAGIALFNRRRKTITTNIVTA